MRTWCRCLIFMSVFSTCSLDEAPPAKDKCPNISLHPRTFRLHTACNVTYLDPKQQEEIQAPPVVVLVPVLYLLAFLLGVPANLLALWVLVFRTKRLPSTVLLINLTAADCVLLLALPFRAVYHLRGNHWTLGEASCRAVMAIFYGNMYASIMCLALVALDRYVALVHPFSAKTLRSWRTSLYMTAAVWTAALAAMLPLLLSQQTYRLDVQRITTCHDVLPEDQQRSFLAPYFASLFSACFLLPLLAVLFCHGAVLRALLAEGRRYGHTVRVTALVLVVFVACLLPSNVLMLLSVYGGAAGGGQGLYVPYMISLAVSTFNSSLDPFIFYYVSAQFRAEARAALGLCGAGCRRRRRRRTISTPACAAAATSSPSSLQNNTSSSGQRSKVTLLTLKSNSAESQTA